MDPLRRKDAARARAARMGFGCALLVLGLWPAAAPSQEAQPAQEVERLQVAVERAGRVASGSSEPLLGFVSGLARLSSLGSDALDVLLVLDASASTLASAGADIDGDGRVVWRLGSRALAWLGLGSGLAGPDSILAAEVAAAIGLLERLDPRTARVGVVAYAGGGRGSADNAWVLVPLTDRFERVRAGLRELRDLYPPAGSSDLPAGLRLARIELGNRDRARRSAAHLVVVSGGLPSSPREGPLATEEEAIRSARRLGEEGVRIHAYAVGRLALEQPRASIKVAEQSGGQYVPVAEPADLLSALPEIDLSEIDQLRVRHRETGESALQLQRSPDGSFGALVPLRPGQNEIEVSARTTKGRRKQVIVTIDAESAPLSPEEVPELERFERRAGTRELRIDPPSR